MNDNIVNHAIGGEVQFGEDQEFALVHRYRPGTSFVIWRLDDVPLLEIQTRLWHDLERRHGLEEELEEVRLVGLELVALLAHCEVAVQSRDPLDERGGHAELPELGLDGVRRLVAVDENGAYTRAKME